MVRLGRRSHGGGGAADNYFAVPGSFAAFYRRNYPRLVKYFVRRVREPHQALDLTAETFAKAFEARMGFRGGSEEEARAWVFAIGKRQLAQLYRDGAVETGALKRLEFTLLPPDDEDLRRVEEIADARASGVKDAVSELTPAEREVVERHFIEELPFTEIVGDSGDEKPDAARMRLNRARRKLAANRRLLRRLGRESDDGER